MGSFLDAGVPGVGFRSVFGLAIAFQLSFCKSSPLRPLEEGTGRSYQSEGLPWLFPLFALSPDTLRFEDTSSGFLRLPLSSRPDAGSRL